LRGAIEMGWRSVWCTRLVMLGEARLSMGWAIVKELPKNGALSSMARTP
jgi:hypothetical protein